MSLFDFLKAELHARDWSMTDLARKAGCSKQIVSQWLAEDPAERIVPSPASCAKIASALRVDADYVLQLAGHRNPRPADEEPSDAQLAISAAVAEMQEILRDLPRGYWGTVIKAFSRGVEGARDMAQLLSESTPSPSGPVTSGRNRRVTDPKPTDNSPDYPPVERLPKRQHSRLLPRLVFAAVG
jgi:transcriptional regulator with XRE-family HTH domain